MHNHKNYNIKSFLVDFCKMCNHRNVFNLKKGTVICLIWKWKRHNVRFCFLYVGSDYVARS